MKNLNDEEDDYDYSPNELARLSSQHRQKYEEIVSSNLDEGISVTDWENENLRRASEYLAYQRYNRRSSY